jgi:hypothetical protein
MTVARQALFSTASKKLLKNSSRHKAANSAGYDAHREFFHAMYRILFEIGGDADHVRT